MRRFLFAAFGMIAMALPGCAAAAASPMAPPVALLPPGAPMPQGRPTDSCSDPVTRTVRVYRHHWFRGRLVTRVRLERRIVACKRYHPPSVFVGGR